jgi:hypothetical protein
MLTCVMEPLSLWALTDDLTFTADRAWSRDTGKGGAVPPHQTRAGSAASAIAAASAASFF